MAKIYNMNKKNKNLLLGSTVLNSVGTQIVKPDTVSVDNNLSVVLANNTANNGHGAYIPASLSVGEGLYIKYTPERNTAVLEAPGLKGFYEYYVDTMPHTIQATQSVSFQIASESVLSADVELVFDLTNTISKYLLGNTFEVFLPQTITESGFFFKIKFVMDETDLVINDGVAQGTVLTLTAGQRVVLSVSKDITTGNLMMYVADIKGQPVIA